MHNLIATTPLINDMLVWYLIHDNYVDNKPAIFENIIRRFMFGITPLVVLFIHLMEP